jgi:hypothetical protein
MSWDIFVMDLPANITSLTDLPKDFVPAAVGLRSEVIAKLSMLYPECDFGDPSWGTLQIPGCSIEFNLGADEKLQSFAMHVRGGDHAPDVVAHILEQLGMRAVDVSSDSGLFEHDPVSRSESFARWRSYRSFVVGCGDASC